MRVQLERIFAEAVRTEIANWMVGRSLQSCADELSDPVQFSNALVPNLLSRLQAAGVTRYQLKQLAWGEPCIHLQGVFPTEGYDDQLPETPVDFLPVPDCQATIAARASAMLCLATIDSSVVSYASENDGHLFVNLVALDGNDHMAEKSKSSMRGHTDGVFFPIRGECDEKYPNFAPSPDFVCLSALRNPNSTETTVMPLAEVLSALSDSEIAELCKPQFSIVPQKTFRAGLARSLGWTRPRPPRLDNRSVLFRRPEGFWVRFSHSSVTAPLLADDGSEETGIDVQNAASSAVEAFVKHCVSKVRSVVISPGDILLVNNRIGLHGRSGVGEEVGGQSRWLLRTYGLEISDLVAEMRYDGSTYKLYP